MLRRVKPALDDTRCQDSPSAIDYSDLLRLFGVACLENRRRQYDIMFVAKLYKNHTDCAALLAHFPLFIAPRATRNTEQARGVFHVPFARVDAVQRSLFVRAPSFVNKFLFQCTDADVFHDSLRELRANVSTYVKEL